MKKKHKKIIIISTIVLFIAVGVFLYFLLRDKNKLTISEKEWISDNNQTVINIAVANNLNIFGVDGTGVFFEFLNDFGTDYNLTINPVPFNYGAGTTGLALTGKQTVEALDYVFYEDHYVLVGKNEEVLSDISALANVKYAVLSSDQNYIKSYLPSITTVPFDNKIVLMDSLQTNEEISYAIVPLNMFVDQILANNYWIAYHFSDIPFYYTLSFPDEGIIKSILTKYSNIWMDGKFDKYYNSNNLSIFLKSLNITEKDKDILTNKIYNYGLVSSAPYETIMSGNFGGTVGVYLKKFTAFSGVEFKYTNYKDVDDLVNAASDKKIDMFFDYYQANTTFERVNSSINVDLAIIAPTTDDIVITRVEALRNKTVYAEENSRIYAYLKSLGYVNLVSYDGIDGLEDLDNEEVLIALEKSAYLYYKNHGFENYSLRFEKNINDGYDFRINGDATFYKLFKNYINSLDVKKLSYSGVESYIEVTESGSFISTIAKYALIIIVITGTIVFFFIKSKKKIKVNKKIRKEDKMRFIDQLTSLKNRNYLKENIEGWNNNTIYPQAAVVVDLNNVKYINDTYGTNEGDKQITAAANILIKTQIDNTDIIRTDGNEFLVYMLGFEEKRVISYMRKLYKEFNTLPYQYGAAIGYSMRTDDLKTIDDSINEATLDMRSKKEAKEEKI